MPWCLTLAFEQVVQVPSMVQLSPAVCDASSSLLEWNSVGRPVTVFAHTSVWQCDLMQVMHKIKEMLFFKNQKQTNPSVLHYRW